MKIETARVYDILDQDKKAPRFLVDRLWPRGVKKEILQLDGWAKNLSPSNELRKWYNHDPKKWEEFKIAYFEELDKQSEELRDFIDTIKKHNQVTLVYSSTEREVNNAVALKEYLLAAM